MTLKFIKRPAPVAIAPQLSYSFADAVLYLVDNAQTFRAPQSVVRAGDRIVKACEGDGAIIELREEDWKLLYVTVEAAEPFGAWMMEMKDDAGKLIAREAKAVPPRLFLGFANAIAEAANEDPRKP